MPPGLTLLSNVSRDCWLRIIAVSKCLTIGELILSLLRITMTFAVPPRISGPYDGIQLTSMSCMIPEYAIILPIDRTPCPPNPAIIISSFIISEFQCYTMQAVLRESSDHQEDST